MPEVLQMILKNNRWWDDNKNSWSAEIETEESAKLKSDSLVNCYSCYSCESCKSCTSCEFFKKDPERYFKNNIGSRDGQVKCFWIAGKSTVVCGCFTGNLLDFEKAVEKTHGDNEFGEQYKKYIAEVRSLMG
jgi:hypothetical protein